MYNLQQILIYTSSRYKANLSLPPIHTPWAWFWSWPTQKENIWYFSIAAKCFIVFTGMLLIYVIHSMLVCLLFVSGQGAWLRAADMLNQKTKVAVQKPK